jgi:mRNA interferase MazF
MTEPQVVRGEVWLTNFTPGMGSEQHGLRPALILQNDAGNRLSRTTIVAIITTTIRRFPVTVVVEPPDGGLERRSMVHLAQLYTIDQGRLQRRLGALTASTMREVETSLLVSLGIQRPAGRRR